MMDLSHLKVGDSVRLANGDIESVLTVDPGDDHMMIYLTNGKWYTHRGEWVGASENCDITEIITPALSVNSCNTLPTIWPEPITDRQPTADDADADGDIQYMNAGGWFCHEYEPGAEYEEGWQHTPMWKPRELDRKMRTIQALQAAVDECTSVDLETLEVAIELLAGRE